MMPTILEAPLSLDDLPDFIPDQVVVAAQLAKPRAALQLPSGWVETIEAHRCQYCAANDAYVFFDRPGFWLCIYKSPYRDDQGFTASVLPEKWQPGTSTFERYAPADLAPEFTGRGAVAKATAFCEGLIAESEGWLSELGIELTTVGAWLWHGTGRGSLMSVRSFSVGARCFL